MSVDSDPPTPERQLFLVQRYVRNIRHKHPEWDTDDLEGAITVALVRWPPKHPSHVMRRAVLTTKEWQRERLGGRKKDLTWDKAVTSSLDAQLTPTLRAGEVIPGDEDVVLGEPIDLPEKLLASFSPVDQAILQMLSEGYKQTEIAEQVGLTRGAVNVRLRRMRPKLAHLLWCG